MNQIVRDMALDELISASQDVSPGLSVTLLSAIYKIEKFNQFDQDRDVLLSIQKLIEEEVDALLVSKL